MSKRNQRVYPSSDMEKRPAEATKTGVIDGNETEASDDPVDRIMRYVAPSNYNYGSDRRGYMKDGSHMKAPKRGKHRNFLQLGRLDVYDVDPASSDGLWRLEANRLVAAGTSSKREQLLFSSLHGLESLDFKSFHDLAELTDKILCALHICTLDDQAVLHEKYPSAVDKGRWMQCQSALRNRTDDSHDLPGGERSRTQRAAIDKEMQMTSVDHPGLKWEAYHEEHEQVVRTEPRRETSDEEGEEDTTTMGKTKVFTRSSQRREPEETLQMEVNPSRGQDESDIETHETPSVPRSPPRSRVRQDSTPSHTPASMPPRHQSTTACGSQSSSMTSALGMSAAPTLPTSPQLRSHGRQTGIPSRHGVKPKKAKAVHFLAQPSIERRQTSNPRKLQPVTDPERYCAVVDHITAVLANIATQCAKSSYWRTVIIAVLTILSTKLKVVAIDLPTNAEVCLSRSSSTDPLKSDDEVRNARPGEWQLPRISDSDADISRYYTEYSAVGHWLTSCLTQALVELGAKRPVHVPIAKFDACAVIFRSGADNVLTLMHQDRHGNAGGLCDALALAFSGAAISLAIDLGQELKKQQSATGSPPSPGQTDSNTSISSVLLDASSERLLSDDELELRTISFKLVNVTSLVTLLVPLSLAKASLAHEFKRTLQAMSALSALGDVVPEATNFTALVQLSSEGFAGNDKQGTSAKDIAQQGRSMSGDLHVDRKDVKPLSQSGLAMRRLQLLDPDAMNPPSYVSKDFVNSRMMVAKERLESLNGETEGWVIDGGAVIVKCPKYVCITVAFCFVLVLGGFMIGFFVGERIPGVDPFGIASFTWVLAGFIILIAKSVRVSEWPWRDFLLGRVTCRSITELHSVTKVDAQDIILYFLSTRERNLLRTCGPFNTPFRELRPGGFSIDVKIKLQTLWACGIIPLEVSTLDGPKVVLLDLTRGQNGLTSAEHYKGGYAQNDDYIASCMAFPAGDHDRDAPLILSRTVPWIKVIGIYNCMETTFR